MRRFPTLDLLRGVAAMAVVLFHGHAMFGVPVNGHLCVDLFFCLSGFVLGYAYDRRLHDGMTAAAFLRARLIRLYPLYLFGTLIGFGILVSMHVLESQRAVLVLTAALLLLPASHPDSDYIYPLNIPAWSLFFELLVNIAYALSRLARIDVLVGLAAVVLAATTARSGSLHMGNAWDDVWGGFARVGFSFFAGVLVWRLFSRQEPRPLPRWIVVPLLAAFCLTMLVQIDRQWMFELPVVLFVFPLLIYLAARTPLPGRFGTVATQAGLASYPLYVVHWPILNLHQPLDAPGSPLWWGIVPLLIAGSIGLERFVHEPIKAWLERRSARAPARSAQPSA
jgi:peptidoglycan/LPS O-acetylase OafA/YrhL